MLTAPISVCCQNYIYQPRRPAFAENRNQIIAGAAFLGKSGHILHLTGKSVITLGIPVGQTLLQYVIANALQRITHFLFLIRKGFLCCQGQYPA